MTLDSTMFYVVDKLFCLPYDVYFNRIWFFILSGLRKKKVKLM